MSALENDLATLIKLHGLPEPKREFRFAPPRRFRFDFAWGVDSPLPWVAAECEGGSWVAGRHGRGKGFESDCRKYNLATSMGWRVFRFTHAMIKSGEAIRTLNEALGV